jgi:hypothetical protein
MHPFGGLDRIPAVTAAGLFAYQLGGRALSLVLSAFVLAMGVGGSMGAIDARLPYVEATIAPREDRDVDARDKSTHDVHKWARCVLTAWPQMKKVDSRCPSSAAAGPPEARSARIFGPA